MIDVSILIVSWNTSSILADCLRSVYEHTTDVAFEVIVVDNASADDSVAMVRRDFPNVRLIENETNCGFAAANNQAIAAAAGRYVLLLNSDTILLDNAVARTVSHADANPDSAVVGCRVLNPDRTLQITCFMFPSVLNMVLSTGYLYKIFPKSRFFGREFMTWWDRNDARPVDVVSGCFMLVRRTAIDHVGMLDDSYFMYAEETDWCYRFKKAGYTVLYTPSGTIIHLGGASSRRIKPEMTMQLRASILRFVRKHKGRLHYVPSCCLVSLFLLLRAPLWLAKASVSPKSRRADLLKSRTYLIAGVRALAGWKALAYRNHRQPKDPLQAGDVCQADVAQ